MGLDALARGLDAWRKSRKGERAGKAVGFPELKPSVPLAGAFHDRDDPGGG